VPPYSSSTIAQIGLLIDALEERQEVLGEKDADDLVDRFVVDRDPAVTLANERIDDLVHGGGDRHGGHAGPRNHHLVQTAVAELDDGADHLLFFRLEDALLAAALHYQLEFLCADLRLPDVCAEAAGDLASQPGEQGHQRAKDLAYHVERARQRQRHPVGPGQGQRLGHQLAENDGEQGQQKGDDEDRNAGGVVLDDRKAGE